MSIGVKPRYPVRGVTIRFYREGSACPSLYRSPARAVDIICVKVFKSGRSPAAKGFY